MAPGADLGVGMVVAESGIDGSVTVLWQQFHDAINSGSRSLWWWLGAEEVSTSEQARLDLGRRVLGILAKCPADLSEDDADVMERVLARSRALRGGQPEQR